MHSSFQIYSHIGRIVTYIPLSTCCSCVNVSDYAFTAELQTPLPLSRNNATKKRYTLVRIFFVKLVKTVLNVLSPIEGESIQLKMYVYLHYIFN